MQLESLSLQPEPRNWQAGSWGDGVTGGRSRVQDPWWRESLSRPRGEGLVSCEQSLRDSDIK
jgi:hypothetical protein